MNFVGNFVGTDPLKMGKIKGKIEGTDPSKMLGFGA